MVAKKRRRRKKVDRPFCWYCERKFVDERVLIMHQKARHFKCDTCFKKLGSGAGLAVHVLQMHGRSMKSIPNSKSGRDSIEKEIYGMDGLTAEDIIEFRKETDTRNLRQKQKLTAQQQGIREPSSSAEDQSASTGLRQATVVLVFSSTEFSQEELRARMDKYAYDEAKVKKQFRQLDSAIESRLAQWVATR